MPHVPHVLAILGALLLSGFDAAPAAPAQPDPPRFVAAVERPEVPALRRAMPDQPRLVVVLGANDGAETTDFIVPYGILKAAGVAEVTAVAPRADAIRLMPALEVLPDETIAAFEARRPRGADVVVVPAMHDSNDPEIHAFLQRQAAAGALIVSICDGAWVSARAGLLDGRRATAHWMSLPRLDRKHPETVWVRGQRIVVDGPIMSTTGVSASAPASLILVEALSDRAQADRVAAAFGIAELDTAHDTAAFRLTPRLIWTGLSNLAAVWGHETLGIELGAGFNEVALALQADGWSRTYRSRIEVFGPGDQQVSARGLRVLTTPGPRGAASLALASAPGQGALAETLAAIEGRYGPASADLVAVQMEFPR